MPTPKFATSERSSYKQKPHIIPRQRVQLRTQTHKYEMRRLPSSENWRPVQRRMGLCMKIQKLRDGASWKKPGISMRTRMTLRVTAVAKTGRGPRGMLIPVC